MSVHPSTAMIAVSGAEDSTLRFWLFKPAHGDEVGEGELVANFSVPKVKGRPTRPRMVFFSPSGNSVYVVLVGMRLPTSIVQYRVAVEVVGKKKRKGFATPRKEQASRAPAFKVSVTEGQLRQVSAETTTACSVSVDGSLLCLGTTEGSVFVYDIRSLRLIASFKELHSQNITSLSISPNNRLLVSTCMSAQARVSRIRTEHHNVLIWILVCIVAVLATIVLFFHRIN
eukprot:NODE_436_length_916_cov_284.469105_g428_i0.p1 GENE.NODE_436_length_916_cov_284.469105_g428_i0~~NODE_436_length_916_cov_284.469105_g428_i0.p1  ORF type:complete len:228 (-),score=7.27 NODE_436_length_916_cov_284.469105_g428_i0:74-757(-)